MRLAISPTSPGLGSADLVELVVEAERLGYDAAWLAEVAGPEAFSLAGAVAARTRRIEVGVAVVPAATRSAALLAMGSATVSGLLGGRRFSLGVGASSQVIVESWHDRDFSPPVARVRDAVGATRALLGGAKSFDSETARVARFRLAVPPAGPIRIFVGALGPRMLRLAGAVADGVCLNLMTVEHVPQQLAAIRQGAEEAGRESTERLEVMARFHVVVTDDMDAGRSVVRHAFGPYFAQPVYNRYLATMGYAAEADALRDAFSAGDRAGVAAAMRDEIVDGVALVGPPDRIRQRLDEYAAVGVDVGALSFIASDPAGVAEAMRQLAPA